MGKPSIGKANIVAVEKDIKHEVKELTVLEEGSEESIYNLIFNQTEAGGMESNE